MVNDGRWSVIDVMILHDITLIPMCLKHFDVLFRSDDDPSAAKKKNQPRWRLSLPPRILVREKVRGAPVGSARMATGGRRSAIHVVGEGMQNWELEAGDG